MNIDLGIILENEMKKLPSRKSIVLSGTLSSAGSCPCWQEDAYNRTEDRITTECATQSWEWIGTEKKCDFTGGKML